MKIVPSRSWKKLEGKMSTFIVLFLLSQAQETVDVFSQRWFYGGKLLGDKTTIEEAKVAPGYIIQVIINTEKQAAS